MLGIKISLTKLRFGLIIQFGNAAYCLKVASKWIVVLEGGRGPELEGTVPKAIYFFFIVDDIECDRYKIQSSDKEAIGIRFLYFCIYFPEGLNHVIEISFPCPHER